MTIPASTRKFSRLWIVVIAALAVLFVAWMVATADDPDAADAEEQPVAIEPDLPRPVGSLDRPVPVRLTDGDPTATDKVPPPPPAE